MFVFSLTVLLLLKITSEQEDNTKLNLQKREIGLFDVFPKVKESIFGSKQDNLKINKQISENTLHLAIDEDPEFPVYKDNEILLDNRDADIIGQGKGIKRFLQGAMGEYKFQSDNVENITPTILSNSELSNAFSFLVTRKKRNVVNKVKFKYPSTTKFPNSNNGSKKEEEISKTHYLQLNKEINDEDEIAKIHDLHLSEYRPGHECDPKINTVKKNNKSNSPPTVLFDDYVNDENYVTFVTKHTSSTQKPESKAQGQTTCEKLKNISTIHISMKSTGCVQTSSSSNCKTSPKTTEKSSSGVTKSKSQTYLKNNITKPLLNYSEAIKSTVPLPVKKGTTIKSTAPLPVKKGTTEDICKKRFNGTQQTFNGQYTPPAKGYPTTVQPTKKLIEELIKKLKNNSIISNKSSTKSFTITLIKEQEEEKKLKQPPIIQKVFGIAPKTTHKIPSATLNEKECITPKRDKVHPARQKGGDAGNHYFHGKHFYSLCQRTEFNIRTQSICEQDKTETKPMTDTTRVTIVTPQIVRKTEPVQSFITKRKFGHANRNTVVTEPTICAAEINEIKEILPQGDPGRNIIFSSNNKKGLSMLKNNKRLLRTQFNFTL